MSARAPFAGGLRRLLDPGDTGLHAVLDAAREDRVLASLLTTGVEHASLYEGHQGAALADVAPYLVHVAHGSPLLPELVRGWGRACGIFLRSRSSPRVVRARLRRLLLVKAGESEQSRYFRFYDPRVLRVMLPLATPRQASWFFGEGEIDAYVVEDHEPRAALLLTQASAGAVHVERVALDEDPGETDARAG